MAHQSVPETVEIAVHWTFSGANIVNTFHAKQAGGYNQAGIEALADAVDDQVLNLMADLHSRFVYVKTVVRGLEFPNDIMAENSDNAGNCDYTSGYPLPANVAFCVQRLSGLTGRSARGRVYICGIPFNYKSTAGGEEQMLTSVAAAAYVGHIDGFRSAIDNTGTFDPVIVSRYSGGAKRAIGVTFDWIQTVSADRKLDTMRRRMF